MKYREIIEGIPMGQKMLSVSPKKEYTIGFEFEMAVDNVEDIDSDETDYDGGIEDAWEAFSNYWYSGGSTFDFTDWFDRYIRYDTEFERFVEENDIEPKYGYVETVKTIVDIENENKKKNTKKRLDYYNDMVVFDLEDYINQYTNDPEKFLNNREQVKNLIIFVDQTVQNNEPRSESGWNKIFQQMDDERLRKNLDTAIEILKTAGIVYTPIDPEDVELGEYIWKDSDQTEIVNIREDLYDLEDMLEYFDTDVEELRDLTSSSWEYEESEQFSSAFNDWYVRNSQSGKIGYIQNILRSTRDLMNWFATEEAQIEVDVEVITDIMPLNDGIRKLKKMLGIMRRDEKISTNSATGLHINIGTFEDFTKIDWLKFLIVYHPRLALSQFGREFNTYAMDRMSQIINDLELGKAVDSKSMNAVNEIVIKNSQKMSSVNLSKLRTKKHIEIRAPGGEDYEDKENIIVNQIQRAIRALEIASDPNSYRNEYLKKLVKVFGRPEDESKVKKLFHNFGIRYLEKAPLVTIEDLLRSDVDFTKFDSLYTLAIHRELVENLKKYEYPNNVKGVLNRYVEKIPNLKNYKFFRLLSQSFN